MREMKSLEYGVEGEGEVTKSLVKGMLAGLIGGLVATAAKSVVEKIYPPHAAGAAEPETVLAERIAGHRLRGADETAATAAIHWGFGALAGAAYGGLAEYFPAATAKDGASFGLALATLTQETALPAMGLAEEAGEQTVREQTSEMTSHVVYGLITETVRRLVRPRLG